MSTICGKSQEKYSGDTYMWKNMKVIKKQTVPIKAKSFK